MASRDVFALKNSDLNAFLFSNVGTELNGSDLTILSILARLGQDPWSEAGRLSRLPRTAAIDWLAERIARMPLTAAGLSEARATAARLILLLPTGGSAPVGTVRADAAAMKTPRWVMIAVISSALALGFAASSMRNPAPSTAEQIQHEP